MAFGPQIGLCNHDHDLFQNNFITPQEAPSTILPSPLWKPLICFLSPWVCLFWAFCIDGIAQYVASFNQASFTQHNSLKVHPRCWINGASLLYMTIWCSVIWNITLKKSIRVWIYIWVLCTMVNNANMNSHVEISLWTYFLGINLRVEFLGQW